MKIPEGDEGEFTTFTEEQMEVFNLPMGNNVRWELI